MEHDPSIIGLEKKPHFQVLKEELDVLYSKLWNKSVLDRQESLREFQKLEQEIGENLKRILSKNVRVEITSDDPTEMLDGDWNYPLRVEIYEDDKLIGQFDPYDEFSYENFLSQNKK
ncbi:MAG: hypothetical protein Q7R73_04045 [bacterium]|nr:hypothetical protein [bacterium]